MSLQRYFLTTGVAGSLLLTSLQADELGSIKAGRHQVHPSRLLARAALDTDGRSVSASAQAAIEAAGLRITRSYKLVPGLVALEPRSSIGTAAAVTDEAKVDKLLDRIRLLEGSGSFVYVQPDYVRRADVTATDPKFVDGTAWGLLNQGQDGGVAGIDVGAVPAWQITTGSTNVIVAIIDTGIRYTHVDLRDQMWVNEGETGVDAFGRDKRSNGVDDDGNGVVDDVYGLNAITGSGNPFDDQGHGTHTAGTIGAAANNGYAHVGVSWKVRLMGCKFLSSSGGGFDADAIDCLNYAVQMGAKISNNSWGGAPFNSALFDAIQQAGARGHLFIAAAGNDGLNNDIFPHYPANYPSDNLISVAAVDRKGLLATFSDFGKNTVHIAAPGVDIFSTFATSDLAYASESGTSMACPHVAGVAALVAAAHPDAGYSEIRERILSGAVKIPAAAGTTSSGGLVNAYNAIQATADGILEFSANPPIGSSILVGVQTPVYIKLTDVVGVRGASITALIDAPGVVAQPVSFLDNGVAPDLVAGDAIYSALIPAATAEGAMAVHLTAIAANKEPLDTSFTYKVGGRPLNDNFAKARKVSTGGQIISDSTRFSTLEPGEPKHAKLATISGSLWYAWAPSFTGKALVETVGSAINTYIAVYTGDTLGSLKEVASIDDEGTKRNGSMVINVTSGTTYRIAVGGVDQSQDGAIRLRVAPNATPDILPPLPSINSPASGLITTTDTIDVEGVARDQEPSPSGVQQVLVKLNENIAEAAEGTEAWRRRGLRLRPGPNVIEVIARDVSENVSDPVRVTVTYLAETLPNDHFANATTLVSNEGSVDGNNILATREFGEPLHAGNQGGRSVWYTFTAPKDGVLTLDTAGSAFDTVIAAYLGERLGELASQGSNDDANPGSGFSHLEQAVRQGNTLRIALDGFAGQSGDFKLKYSFVPKALRQLTVGSGLGGGVDLESGLYADGASISVTATPDDRHDFVSWSGTKTSYAPRLAFTISEDTTITANFQGKRYTDDFESGDLKHLAWQGSVDSGWSVTQEKAALGKFSAKSATIPNGAQSSLKLSATVRSGIGSFEYKVSSEAGWDYLEFYIDGVLMESWSGDVDWTRYAFSISAGTHALEWRYSKDVDRSAGLDAAFIDNLMLPAIPGIDSTTPARLKLVDLRNGIAQIRLEGQVGQTYVTQVSNDLKHWSTLSSAVNETGFILITDNQAVDLQPRFYRSVVLP